MNPKFELVQSNGDATAVYNVTFDTPTTVCQLLKFAQKRKEWGTLTVIHNRLVSTTIEFNFTGGNDCYGVLRKIPKSIYRTKLIGGDAVGGWSRMDYCMSVSIVI